MLVITGPTGTGKSELAIKLAEKFNGEIVSADSMQIYKFCNIGTAKIKPHEQRGIPHHLIDIVNPDEDFTVSNFRAAADKAILDIINRGKVPIVAGGTGFYIKGLLYDYGFGNAIADSRLRNELEAEATLKGDAYLYELLKKTDPLSAEKIHPNDRKRIIRAIEIYKLTGKRKSELSDGTVPRYKNFKIISLYAEREVLYNKINNRVDKMLEEGLLNEVKSLEKYKDCNSMQAIGYKELFLYLNGELSFQDAIELIKKNTRNYAKRQLTFMRKLDAEFLNINQDILCIASDIIRNM